MSAGKPCKPNNGLGLQDHELRDELTRVQKALDGKIREQLALEDRLRPRVVREGIAGQSEVMQVLHVDPS